MEQLDREEFRHFAGLYPHQVEGVAFLTSKGRAILGDDMGLGKTRQAIVAMNESVPEGAVLVVCPASLKLNWRQPSILTILKNNMLKS
jgi:SWI/SNF-related matrix-associated actin-dependent regulator 1 of chromatin subfamily A